MKLQYASDLHLENRPVSQWLAGHMPAVAGEVLLLAGDIMHLPAGESAQVPPFIDWCSRNYRLTLIVPGNHEYYGGCDVLSTLQGDYDLALRPNVHYCNNRSVMLGDVEVLLTTMWTRIAPQNAALVQEGMSDCRHIDCGGRLLEAGDYGLLHEHCTRWLDEALRRSTARCKVVVTHHCPMLLEDPRYKPNGLSDAFVVDMTRYIEQHHIDHWIYGHTHYNAGEGTRVGGTTMHCNQLAYSSHGPVASYTSAATVDV